MRRPKPQSELLTVEAWLNRARRARRRGESRKALVALRSAAHADEGDARVWTLYGVQCAVVGKVEDAVRALGRARWLRERARDGARAHVTKQLEDALSLGGAAAFRARFAT